jgi:hypothetical protein
MINLDDLTSRKAVLEACALFDQMGRDAFLKAHGFGPARQYFLLENGKRYDSKAIVGVAYGLQHRTKVTPQDFSGGEATVQRVLERLRFKVQVAGEAQATLHRRLSALLQVDQLITRERLKEIIGTGDATINTGVFRPSGFDSVLLFVTESKTRDRTQFEDLWDGTELQWQGQLQGRKDHLVAEHRQLGLEVLVFYRKQKYEFEGAAFRYLGPFEHIRHWGANPTSFILRPLPRADVELDQVTNEGPIAQFEADNIADARRKVLREIVRRRGQPAFRRSLLRAYGGRCAVTGCDIEWALEAAHIHPFRGDMTNDVRNGLLLRADIHTLFDLGLVAVHPTELKIWLSAKLRASVLAQLHGTRLRLPPLADDRPSAGALAWHFERAHQ